MKEFIPFHSVNDFEKVLGVDCFHPKAFSLSHWKGAKTPAGIEDDTSAGICFNALLKAIPELSYRYVTSNHFDIDGFIGVWALMNPVLALHYEEVLREMALIGDFREYHPDSKAGESALKLVCWINAEESARFYAPFESHLTAAKEGIACVNKFKFFLEHFESVLLDPDSYQSIWNKEYLEVQAGIQALRKAQITDVPDLRLRIIQVDEPIHYYAHFSESESFDLVATCYAGNRYELEYKYTTWVDCHLRKQFPRIDLSPLVSQLNLLEGANPKWTADKITDTGPILRLEETALSKYERFLSPNQRKIASSSIAPEIWIETITTFFEQAYKNLKPVQTISWDETRKLNRLEVL